MDVLDKHPFGISVSTFSIEVKVLGGESSKFKLEILVIFPNFCQKKKKNFWNLKIFFFKP